MNLLNKPYIFLDYNVIKYMKNEYISTNKEGYELINGIKFYTLVKSIRKRYCFPICESHLLDLKKSNNPGNEDRVLDDLNYMSHISGNTALAIERTGEQRVLLLEGIDIRAEFQKITSEVDRQQPSFSISGMSYNVDMNKLSQDSIFSNQLQKNNGLMNADVMGNVLREIWENIDNPEYYAQFKRNVISLKNNLLQHDTAISNFSEEIEKAIKYLEFFEENDGSLFEEKAIDFCKWLDEVGGVNMESMSLHHKIEKLYMVLDFHPVFSEATNRKNRPSNIMRDCKACIYGASAKFLITEDHNFYRKTKVVYKSLGIKTEVKKMSEFMNLFS